VVKTLLFFVVFEFFACLCFACLYVARRRHADRWLTLFLNLRTSASSADKISSLYSEKKGRKGEIYRINKRVVANHLTITFERK